MTITDGEIIALTVVIAVLAIGTAVICFRCFKAIKKAHKEEKAAKLRHTPERGFYISGYVEGISKSFRTWSFRNKEPPAKVAIPKVHVATVDDLVNERSDLHPAYKQHKQGLPKEQDRSPDQGQGDYHHLEEDDESTADIRGFENPMYGDMNSDMQPPAELYHSDELQGTSQQTDEIKVQVNVQKSDEQATQSSDGAEAQVPDDPAPVIEINTGEPYKSDKVVDVCDVELKPNTDCVFSALYKQGDVNFTHEDKGNVNSDSFM